MSWKKKSKFVILCLTQIMTNPNLFAIPFSDFISLFVNRHFRNIFLSWLSQFFIKEMVRTIADPLPPSLARLAHKAHHPECTNH